MKCYDRRGKPISLNVWATTSHTERIVAQTTLPNGIWVSTIHLGLDHAWGEGPPIIFETMVFPEKGEWGSLACKRYTTEEEARVGHAQMVQEWAAKKVEVIRP